MNLNDMVLLLSLCGNNSSPNPDVNLTGYATEKWVTEGFSPKGTAATAVSQHNTAGDSHNDIRLELKAINDRLTAFFDSDNQTLDELSEIVAYITSNKSLIDSITTSKVSVADIINNLTSNVSNKPLSAAQGVVLKGLIDAVSNSLSGYQPKGDYALRSELPTVPTKVSAFTNDAGYLTQHQDISGKLDASALPTAIDTALAQAKASGEFDGERGLPGVSGTSVRHTWDGSVLTITSGVSAPVEQYSSSVDLKGPKGDSVGIKSVTESTESGGSNRITFTDGHMLAVKNGADGITPVRGESYWTPADRQQIKQELTAAIITQDAGESETLVMSQKAVTDLVNEALGENATTQYETVDSVEKMTDTSKAYVLSTTGTIWAYGEKTVESEPTNKFVSSAAVLNNRLSGSSGSVSAADASKGSFVTDFIAVLDFAQHTPFNVRLNFETAATEDNKVVFFNSSKTRIGGTLVGTSVTGNTQPNTTVSNGETVIDIKTPHNSSDTIPTDAAYVRFQLFVKPVGTTLTSADVANITITFDHEGGTKTENVWYDTGMEPSTSGGGGNYVDLIKKVNDNKSAIGELDARVTACETGSETLTIPAFWQDAVAACIAKIKALQVGKNCVTFPFFSDNHQRNGYAGLLIAHVMKECHIPYCFYGGDSISNGTIANEAEMIAQDKAFDIHMSYIPNGRFCRAVGNHDGYWYDGTNKYYYNRNQVYELFLREEAIAQNKHFGDDGTYYYVEDIASKVRFVVLNTNGGSVDDAQIVWFRDMALNVDAGWAVVVISHQPISNHYHANISNAAAVRAIAVESGIEIIGWFSGHIHRDRIYAGAAVNATDDSEGSNMGFKQVVITSDHTGIAYDDATKHTVANDDQSHAIDFVTINRSTRTVNLTRLGIGSDRSYNY